MGVCQLHKYFGQFSKENFPISTNLINNRAEIFSSHNCFDTNFTLCIKILSLKVCAAKICRSSKSGELMASSPLIPLVGQNARSSDTLRRKESSSEPSSSFITFESTRKRFASEIIFAINILKISVTIGPMQLLHIYCKVHCAKAVGRSSGPRGQGNTNEPQAEIYRNRIPPKKTKKNSALNELNLFFCGLVKTKKIFTGFGPIFVAKLMCRPKLLMKLRFPTLL